MIFRFCIIVQVQLLMLISLIRDGATWPEQNSDSIQPDYLAPKKYMEYYNRTNVIKDDLIPRKKLFPYYEITRVVQDGHASANTEGTISDHLPSFQDVAELVTGRTSYVTKNVDKIRYLIRWKTTSHKWSNVQDKTFQLDKNWTVGGPVKVLIHGYTPEMQGTPEEKIKGQRIFDIGNDYNTQNMKNNLIIIDWTSLSSFSYLKYYEAVDSVRFVAKDLANFLIWMKTTQKLISEWREVHLIGFSLGAHVAGGTGQRIKRKTGGMVGRITGIDPAGPQFHLNGLLPRNRDNVLDGEDAEFVDIIHCNMGSGSFSKKIPQLNVGLGQYGTPAQSGHADFYPNGGVTQNGCSYFKNKIGCSHGKCLELFHKSVPEKILACPCTDWERFQNGKCRCTIDSGGVYVGAPANSSARDKYYFDWGG